MSEPESPTFTILLQEGLDSGARLQQLVPLVYEELRRAAQHCLMSERSGHTLQATALVHEAYLKLIGPRQVPWQNRAHFYAAAVQAMRRIIVDHARTRAAESRGGDNGPQGDSRIRAEAARAAALNLGGLPDLSSSDQAAGFLILDRALSRLDEVDTQAAEIVRLRYFAGLTIEETADALGVSAPTVKRAWAFARSWLKVAIESEK
jgi:RNA polymerase sigma factor (TIGR02999 family)